MVQIILAIIQETLPAIIIPDTTHRIRTILTRVTRTRIPQRLPQLRL